MESFKGTSNNDDVLRRRFDYALSATETSESRSVHRTGKSNLREGAKYVHQCRLEDAMLTEKEYCNRFLCTL